MGLPVGQGGPGGMHLGTMKAGTRWDTSGPIPGIDGKPLNYLDQNLD